MQLAHLKYHLKIKTLYVCILVRVYALFSSFLRFSLPLSLTHTHTHAHTQANTRIPHTHARAQTHTYSRTVVF